MFELIKKDLRINQIPMIASVILLITLFVCQDFLIPASTAYTIAEDCGMFGIYSMIAVFGGMSFASERRDRSADFLAILPVPRGEVILSKIIAALLPIGFIWISIGLYYLSAIFAHPQIAVSEFGLQAAFMLAIFGFAWSFSIFLKSPTIAVALSIACFFFFAISAGRVTQYALLVPVIFGIVSMICTTIYYMKRVEP